MFNEGKISKISDLELNRYVNFFDQSYKDNLMHSKFVSEDYPRWSLISDYYAMHDITKLLLAKKFRIKIDFEVHSTTIIVLGVLAKDTIIVNLMQRGYAEFILLANDLAQAKKE